MPHATSMRWRTVCRRRVTGSELRSTKDDLRSTNYEGRFSVMDNNTDHNKVKAEAFVHLVREKVVSNMAHLKLESLTELLTSLVCHITLRDLHVSSGIEVDDELAHLADAAVYFLDEAGLNLKVSCHEE